MLTLAVVFLALAIVAGIFGLFAAGPVTMTLFFDFLFLFFAFIAVHYVRESRARRPFK